VAAANTDDTAGEGRRNTIQYQYAMQKMSTRRQAGGRGAAVSDFWFPKGLCLPRRGTY